jgi:hypothetical protein
MRLSLDISLKIYIYINKNKGNIRIQHSDEVVMEYLAILILNIQYETMLLLILGVKFKET